MNGSSRLALAFDLMVVVVCALFARSAYGELFVNVPGVHLGRWSDPWSMPKSAVTIVLAAALVGVVLALLLVVVLRDPDTQRLTRIAEIAALLTTVGAWVAWNADFLGTAGRFG